MPAAQCLDENSIGSLFEARLGAGEIAEVDDHVAVCVRCRKLLSMLARIYPPAQIAPPPPPVDAVASAPSDEPRLKRLLQRLECEQRVGSMVVDKWRLDSAIGIGGMASVYAATHRNGRRVAIKMLRSEWLRSPTVVARFLREGYVANQIGHPGAVGILDDGITEDGVPFLVMELLEGRSAAEHVREALPVDEVLRVTDEILDVLAAAHDKEIVHRDVKPENVFITANGDVRLLDFGIARMREITREAGSTELGVAMGTPAYMPPEQARGKWAEVDARTDIWSVGATMFALLSGTAVRKAQTSNEELMLAMTQAAPKLHSVNSTISPEVSAIVDRALAFEKGDRWPDARSMQAAVRSARARASEIDALEVASPRRLGDERRSRLVRVAIALSAAAALAVWVVGATGERHAPSTPPEITHAVVEQVLPKDEQALRPAPTHESANGPPATPVPSATSFVSPTRASAPRAMMSAARRGAAAPSAGPPSVAPNPPPEVTSPLDRRL